MATLAADVRTCKKCGEEKPTDAFYAGHTCKACSIARNVARKQHLQAERRQRAESEAERLQRQRIKRCGHCKVQRPFADFYVDAKRPSGMSSWCRECTRAQARYYQERVGPRRGYVDPRRTAAKAFVYSVKAGSCVDCDRAYPPEIMHLHHLDPALKTLGVAVLMRSGADEETLQAEIDKCALLCPTCHALRHWKEAQRGS